MLFLLLALFNTQAQAEPCPTYNEKLPTHVVDVSEFKFFFYPKEPNTADPDIVLVEKAGELFDWQKVYFWADDMQDRVDFYNTNIDISCSFGLDFISARYQEPNRMIHDYFKGDCRGSGDRVHPLNCDSNQEPFGL